MAILNPNEIFFTAFEPKTPNRFILYIDGIPSYLIKGVNAVTLSQPEIVLNHINVYRKVKGRTTWGDIQMTLFDPITPSGALAVMEWVRMHHESVTGPVGDIVSEWVIKGAFIKEANFGDYNWDTADAAINLTMTVGMDYCVLNF
jgi:hypothetical protein